MKVKGNSRAYNRQMSRRKALRKRRISEQYYGIDREHPYYNNLHQYSKNKIHCSCLLCSRKTRNKGRRNRSNYYKSINYNMPDLKRMIAMDYDQHDYDGTPVPRRTSTW